MDRVLVKISDMGVDTFTCEQALEYISTVGGHVVTINPEMIAQAKIDPDFAKIVNSAELVLPDGIGVQIGLKILGHNVKRIAGIEFGKQLIIKFSKENKKIAMIGAKPDVICDAVQNLKKELPDLNVVYQHDGYFQNQEEIISAVIEANPDLVLVALGSPKQEYFINELKKSLPDAVMIGLGGSFDVWAGKVKRAPKIYQKLGFEWLYRTVKEPQRFKRIFPTLPLFLLNVIKERLCTK